MPLLFEGLLKRGIAVERAGKSFCDDIVTYLDQSFDRLVLFGRSTTVLDANADGIADLRIGFTTGVCIDSWPLSAARRWQLSPPRSALPPERTSKRIQGKAFEFRRSDEGTKMKRRFKPEIVVEAPC